MVFQLLKGALCKSLNCLELAVNSHKDTVEATLWAPSCWAECPSALVWMLGRDILLCEISLVFSSLEALEL